MLIISVYLPECNCITMDVTMTRSIEVHSNFHTNYVSTTYFKCVCVWGAAALFCCLCRSRYFVHHPFSIYTQPPHYSYDSTIHVYAVQNTSITLTCSCRRYGV